MQADKSVYYPSKRKPCKLKTLKHYIFSSATGMQHAGSGLKLPCNRTFKFKTAITNAARGEYGNGGASSLGRLEYIWLPLEDDSAVPIGLYRSGKFLAVHSDHLNTPRLITDHANKAVWQWPYSAFGDNAPTGILKATAHPASAYTQDPMTNARLQATNPGIAYNLRFPGQYFDVETGLYQNYFRTYNAAQGRYTQGDPIGLDGGANRFGYAGQNALTNTDPTGLVTECEFEALKAIVKKYGLHPSGSCQMELDPNVTGGAGKTSFLTGIAKIGINPLDPDQYFGSVVERKMSAGLLLTSFHENAHQAQMNGPAPLSFFFDNLSERLTDGNFSSAQTAAEYILLRNPSMLKEFEKTAKSCNRIRQFQK